MPFKSEAQRRFMYSHMPSMAKEWEAHTPKGKKLPKKKTKTKLLKREKKNEKKSTTKSSKTSQRRRKRV